MTRTTLTRTNTTRTNTTAQTTPTAAGAARAGTTGSERPTTAQLVSAARNGCAAAETTLYDHHRPMVVKVARRHGLDDHQCADVVQRSWLKARQGLDGLRRDDRFGPWLAAIARNESISMIRSTSREVGFPDHDLADEHQGAPDRHLMQTEERGMLQAAMTHLDPGERELVRLLFVEGLAYQQVAKVLGKPMGSIGPTRGRVLRRLRHLIEMDGLVPATAA